MSIAQTLARRTNRAFAPFFGPGDLAGRSFYVDNSVGVDTNRNGLSPIRPLLTISKAVTLLQDFDQVFINPGAYGEDVTIPRSLQYISLIGLGGPGGVVITPEGTDVAGIVNEADDIELVNLDIRGNGTAYSLLNRGSRLHVLASILGSGGLGVVLTEGTAAQVTATTHGIGEGPVFEACEFAGVPTGVIITATDQGYIERIQFLNCWFHDLPVASIEELTGAGGAAANRFRELLVHKCIFGPGDKTDGSDPTKWISLDDSNSNTGQVIDCSFPTAINGGLNLVSTALKWIGNMHPAGISNAQPS